MAPEPLLQTLVLETAAGDTLVAEARGLLGRLYKQRYITAVRSGGRYPHALLMQALDQYLLGYRLDRRRFYWHGINAVALAKRARRDGIDIAPDLNADAMLEEIVAALANADSSPDAFELATRLEVLVAQDRAADAQDAALRYSTHPGAEAFEIASTLRQLDEVWGLTDDAPPGSTILPVLRAARLRAEQGVVRLTDAAVDNELKAVHSARVQLEKNFGLERMVTLRWYQTGLERTKSVARVERLDGRGHGTGFLVAAADFFPERPGMLLVTNAHVVNQEGDNGALAPREAQANFQGAQQTVRFKAKVVWSSPDGALDATFLEVAGEQPSAPPLPLSSKKVRAAVPEPLIYIMGHPQGRDLEFSLRDNKLLESNDGVLRYRTPTEPGSSGSPVFDEHGWEVVALHHAGGLFDRLDGAPPPYEANEGIAIRAIQDATRARPRPDVEQP